MCALPLHEPCSYREVFQIFILLLKCSITYQILMQLTMNRMCVSFGWFIHKQQMQYM